MTSRAISLPFSFNNFGQVSYSEDEAKIIQDRIVLAVMTKLGERVMRPDFGSDVYESLFQNTAFAVSTIRSSVTYAFNTWLKYLQLEDVVVRDIGEGALEFEVQYRKATNALIESVNIRSTLFTRAGEVIQEVQRG